MPKILIAIPCNRTILVPTAASIIGVSRSKVYESDVKFEESIYVHNNRNRLVEAAKDYSHIFFVDHDVVFGDDTIERLLAYDKDVISGVYNYRHLPLRPILWQKTPQGEMYNIIPEMMPKSLFKCWGVPGGCLLIKMEVFEKLKKPYFEFYHDKEGRVMSEDLVFCEKLEKAGIDRFVAPEVKVAHIGDSFF
jgi:GT2 family glycosyltransferase